MFVQRIRQVYDNDMSDIITSRELDPSNYFELVPLEQEALAQLEADIAQQWRESASRGEARWYEITSYLGDGGIFIQDKFSVAPLDGQELTKDIPSDAIESDIRLLTIDDIRKRMELDKIYDSYFDETGTVAKLPPIIINES